ncbi:hypothetical protein E4G67_04555, partial [Candidatus Bathyarchaeota archaeon]
MKQTHTILLIMAFSLLVILPAFLPYGSVSAQTSVYTIDKVDHQVQIMYSGHVVILDTIHVSGQVTDGFMIGLPYKYSAYVLKGIAYDDTHVYQLNLGVQLGETTGLYGATVDFKGNTPSVFTVAFVLSNQLITEQGSGVDSLDFPAYPSLAKNVGTCNVTITFPSAPTTITVTKDDGVVNDAVYTRTNLPAYTYAPASASFQVPSGTLQLTTISSLNRQITIDPTGKANVADSYRIISNSTTTLKAFVVSLPFNASNVSIRDEFGRPLSTELAYSATGNIFLANTTLVSFLNSGQSTTLTAQYTLTSATLQGANYAVSDFKLFPNFAYVVDKATITFTPPEGATIVSPQAISLDASSTLTRQTYQDILTVTKESLSYVDNLANQQNSIQLSFDYNPVWVSFRSTFWALLLATIGCIAFFFVRRHQPKEETYADKTEQLTKLETETTTSTTQTKGAKQKTALNVSTDAIREFIDTYEDKKQLKAELKSMDAKAQKGKIPRRQYKVQKSAIETRLQSINRKIKRTKETFNGTTGGYSD